MKDTGSIEIFYRLKYIHGAADKAEKKVKIKERKEKKITYL
jgi:hypothetical protein